MSISSDTNLFRQTMGLFATGVTVIATETNREIHAMTANAVASLSLEPLLVLVCVGKKTRISRCLEGAERFSINILRAEQQSLSTYFAGAWKEKSSPPFRFVPWHGGPRLEGCLASLGCETDQIREGGDHWIVTGKVIALHQGIEPRAPLLFYAGRYSRLDASEQELAPELGWIESPVQVFYDPWGDNE